MRLHILKIWREPFKRLADGQKHHEIRSTRDRDFHCGDFLLLREWDAPHGRYTGEFALVRVTHIERAPQWGLTPGLCVMSVERVRPIEPEDQHVPVPVPATVVERDSAVVGI